MNPPTAVEMDVAPESPSTRQLLVD